jgi:cytochrome P450
MWLAPVRIVSNSSQSDSDLSITRSAAEHNPRVYDDPLTFRPSRWDNISDEGITAFSVGPRACLGKKFAMTESVAFLALLLRDFEVRPLLEPGESIEGWKQRVLGNASIGITLGISKTPVRFIRR